MHVPSLCIRCCPIDHSLGFNFGLASGTLTPNSLLVPVNKGSSLFIPRGGDWCFLAEIVDYKDSASTLILDAKDKADRTVDVSCDIENDHCLDRSFVQRGNTVAILHPVQQRLIPSRGISADLDLILVYSYISG
jgi:hypothetical protein